MDIPGLPARKAALKLLDAVLRRGETLDQAAQPALQGVRSDADRALARALAGEALRWLTDLDALIDSATRQVLPDDAKPRMALRLMLAGWLRLDTPPHAVIATGLPLLVGGPRRLAHGVFSTLVKRGVSLPAAPSLPEPVAQRWGERAAAIASGLAVPPPLDLTLRDPAATAEWAERLGGISLLPGHVRLERGTAVERLEGFREGAWWVQDLAASLPARLLGEGPGRTALDLCAAPGGKTMQLAAAGWQVTAVDSGAKRLQRMQENLARTDLAATLVQADALVWEPEGQFDAVLLDAPCTATGTCRRHPDVLHRIGPRQIAELAELQAALLTRATRWVKPGGRLVYATCSLEPAEGEEQARRIALPADPIRADELPAGLVPTAAGWLRTDPGMLADAGGLDGFFIARWHLPS
ncbi:RsmB/NOP family class I SAM-dependent RNA methyltransferase [Novosphingobium sp.]|uniref:RsmB/NOP family class I SAM-dependent RNA methyltransferase n=1 Tax=Novosphingobium sp. TaxID=1874826 RepID=UPI0022C2657B|nr:RsmB/NOP family class I SAM-dependent RNA methyltransferase [Novosphingobium sp.]MCZ8018280.1 RsmB/NOP family class I SAM-dependent RNA methyltransferase [Novosphingobium sp.]MCZ8033274.1 RsmB/NOP family class I SAM-dependent RNA methyltransferase [Novosphingobium sp.]MCZ8051729.1 RsmB/NOP family class I SAM-dependent RNA methyltransferase [Novosphingobium sp.]MCZ8060271.1 RsmB/NOP family class I SAM-dependent RNA methyltransferase [Novosphingobium sp.]MCZ8231913.1 RsmB/NOP family class I S